MQAGLAWRGHRQLCAADVGPPTLRDSPTIMPQQICHGPEQQSTVREAEEGAQLTTMQQRSGPK